MINGVVGPVNLHAGRSNRLRTETRLEYTGLNKVARRISADGTHIGYHYDTEGRLSGVTNELGERHFFKRDCLDRIIEETDYWGNTTCYKWDGAGRLLSRTDPLGRITHYACDPLGRIRIRTFPDGSSERFSYDQNGNLATLENDALKVERLYDAENRLIEEAQGAFKVNYAYDANGNLIRRTSCLGNTIDYTYDATGRVSAIRINGKEIARIQRTALGLPEREWLSPNLRREYTYTEQGFLRNQTILSPEGRIERRFDYDPMGNVTARRDSDRGDTLFDYDSTGRLTGRKKPEGPTDEYRHDRAGNLLRRATRKNPDGLCSALYGEDTYRFDPRGNLVERLTPEGHCRFEWNDEGRLIAADSDGILTTMAYDAQGRRIRKETNGKRTLFAWEGDRLLAEENEVNGIREYVYYPGSFVPLAVIESDGRVCYYHNDSVGLPQEITDAEGKLLWSASFDALGNMETLHKAEIPNPFRFQGQYYDPELDLCYNRFRYYDPRTCSYISKDPLGLGAGVNLYSYCINNPVNFFDPFGLKTYITLSTSGGGGLAVLSGEGGSILALDPQTGEVHGYTFAAGGVGLGFGGAATAQIGILDMDTPQDITGWGLEVSTFAAAVEGASGQVSGTGPFGNGSMGAAGGFATGAGAGVSGMLTYTWYEGSYNLSDLPNDIQEKFQHYMKSNCK